MTSITLLSVVVLGLGACLSLSAVAGQDSTQKPVVVLDTSLGAITLELYPDKAPITVENFLKYVDEGFYDNLIFHRVMPGFMVQGGGMTDQMVEKSVGKHRPIKNESSNDVCPTTAGPSPWPAQLTPIRRPASSSSTMWTTRT